MAAALIILVVGCALLLWLSRRETPAPPVALEVSMGDRFDVDVVGESHYQPQLEQLAGGRSRDGVNVEVRATLVLDNGNRYDPKAVAVVVEGAKVGHLSRENARRYRARLQEIGQPELQATCPALIVGGWDRGQKGRGHFGIKLDLSEI